MIPLAFVLAFVLLGLSHHSGPVCEAPDVSAAPGCQTEAEPR